METISPELFVPEGVEPTVRVSISGGFDYETHNDSLLTRWIRLRLEKTRELQLREPDSQALSMPGIKMLDRFISLAVNRAKEQSERERVVHDINEMRGHLKLIP